MKLPHGVSQKACVERYNQGNRDISEESREGIVEEALHLHYVRTFFIKMFCSFVNLLSHLLCYVIQYVKVQN